MKLAKLRKFDTGLHKFVSVYVSRDDVVLVDEHGGKSKVTLRNGEQIVVEDGPATVYRQLKGEEY